MSIKRISLQSSHLALPRANREALRKGIDLLRRPNYLDRLFKYPDTRGDANLLHDIERITPNWDGQTLVTQSATQALSLALRLVGERKRVALYIPSYFGTIRKAKELRQIIKPWNTVEELSKLGEFDAIVLTSNHTPPSGISFSEHNKRKIAEIVRKNNAWLIEDNVYEPLWFKREPSPIQTIPDKTIRIGSFSKMVSPAFRLGFMRASPDVLNKIRSMKITDDLSTSLPVQLIVRPALTKKMLDNLRKKFHKRSKLLRKGLEKGLNIIIPKPDGGPFLCLKLPKKVNPKNLQEEVAKKGLYIDTNEHQYPEGHQPNQVVRLHIGAIKKKDIPRAVRILISSIKKLKTK
jgi:2-aminoadipate transaminase